MKKKLIAVGILLGCHFNAAFGVDVVTKAVASCDGGYTVTIIDNGGDESTIKYFVVKDNTPVAQGQGLSMVHNRTAGGLQVTNIIIPPIQKFDASAKGVKLVTYTYIIEYPVTEQQKKTNKQTVSLLINNDLFSQGKDEVLYKCSQLITKSS